MPRHKVLEDEEKITTIPIRPEIKRQFKMEAAARGISMAALLEDAWKDYLSVNKNASKVWRKRG